MNFIFDRLKLVILFVAKIQEYSYDFRNNLFPSVRYRVQNRVCPMFLIVKWLKSLVPYDYGVFFHYFFPVNSQLWPKLYTKFSLFLFLMMGNDLLVSLQVLKLLTRDWKRKENFLWLSIVFVIHWILPCWEGQRCRMVWWLRSVFRKAPVCGPFPLSTCISHVTGEATTSLSLNFFIWHLRTKIVPPS